MNPSQRDVVDAYLKAERRDVLRGLGIGLAASLAILSLIGATVLHGSGCDPRAAPPSSSPG